MKENIGPYRAWQKLFLFCLGIFVAAAFCMKWMEGDLVFNDKLFTVIGLELGYSKQKTIALLSGIDPSVRTILGYHLSFDFIFMPGVYLGIAALCMMGRAKAPSSFAKKILAVLAIAQLPAWGADITENVFLLTWMKNPVIGNEFGIYHAIVYFKWAVALLGVLIAVPFVLRRGVNPA